MQPPYIAAAVAHARVQDIERSLSRPDRMARHELEHEAWSQGRPAIGLEQGGRQADACPVPSWIRDQRTVQRTEANRA